MSRQYSMSTMLRMVPNQLLKGFFEQQDVDLGMDLTKLQQREINPILKSIRLLSREDFTRIEGDLRSIHELATRSGISTIFEAAELCGEIGIAKAMPRDATPYARSMWTWLSQRATFEKAAKIYHITHLNWWRKRNDLPSVEPDLSEAAITSLEESISHLLLEEQGRGQKCTIETMIRFGVYYFFAYPDDYVQNVITHDTQGLLSCSSFHKTFEIIFAYHKEDGALELNARVPHRLKGRLEELFVSTILENDLDPWFPGAAYELDHLKYPVFQLTTDPRDALHVSIRQMVLLVHEGTRKISIEVDTKNRLDSIHHALRDTLDSNYVPLSSVYVRQVTFCFEFLTTPDRKGATVSFNVRAPSTCGLRNCRPELAEIIHKYLKQWEVDRANIDQSSFSAVG